MTKYVFSSCRKCTYRTFDTFWITDAWKIIILLSVATDSALYPVIANFHEGDSEKMQFSWETHKSLWWTHYMNDNFVLWPCRGGKHIGFFDHRNSVDQKIQHTIEMMTDDHLPFLYTDRLRDPTTLWIIRQSHTYQPSPKLQDSPTNIQQADCALHVGSEHN